LTREVFNEIAPGWYGFRHRTIFRPELESLARRWEKGRLLNIGCAHGPDFIPFKDVYEMCGIDFSRRMLDMARRYAVKNSFAVDLIEADARQLPFTDSSFDRAIAVAVYHHIRAGPDRLAALRELHRVLRPGGEAFITVWNRWQPRFWFRRKNTLVPWRGGGKTLYRYYYLFSYGELKKLARQAGFAVISAFPESRYKFPVKWFSRNICLLVKKPG
jgi:tRNA (uracil-5-)-methyltransferase TRM9